MTQQFVFGKEDFERLKFFCSFGKEGCYLLVTLQFLEFLKRRFRVTQQFKSKLRVIQQLFEVLEKKVVSDSAIGSCKEDC